ncbi:Predicted Fe-Mo cluster-binding protein, NifX family [Sporobacter termitidis DSM 10068]|uniref:Predicted Fe-Mo cluster-binding protein, NifX family n=1 Tax=Sporobacter termitidis DSM 10068 TaxID=1123282 RepID=A0A1M5TVI8_9FIRM|nr:NifB/NifX family molybdenum-iron cluster-binding protein [Sporobacter termitidis]SHH54606.1 Predicted Fe-Mo cluster-binding protein, NifX family [Sporobacter termitidis DSM 10068]
MGKNWRVATASTDGTVVDEHFGRAEDFYIYDIGPDGAYSLLEKRSVHPSGEGLGHTEDAMLEKITALRDCCAILVVQIGPGARRSLELNRIAVFEAPGDVGAALRALAKYFVRTNYSPLPGL